MSENQRSFSPEETRSPEQNARWWQECYVEGYVESVLENSTDWAIIINQGGEGVSTILNGFRRKVSQHTLCVDYSPEDWPEDLLEKDSGHLSNLLRVASSLIRNHLKDYPDQITSLYPTQQEFLRWIIQKFNDKRAYPRWLDGLPAEQRALMNDVTYDPDLYCNPISDDEVVGQMEEMYNLVQKLGYKQIVFFLDAPFFLSTLQETQLAALYQWQVLTNHPGFRVLAALPARFVEAKKLQNITTGRVNYINIPVTWEQTKEILSSNLRYSTDHRLQKLDDLVTPALLAEIKNKIGSDFHGAAIVNWMGLVKTLCEKADGEQPLDLRDGIVDEIVRTFYESCLPLVIDPERKIVWRGYSKLKLDDAPFDFLLRVWHAKGEPVRYFGVGISSQNKHTLAKRVREAVEPPLEERVYLHGARNLGYWLKNTKFA